MLAAPAAQLLLCYAFWLSQSPFPCFLPRMHVFRKSQDSQPSFPSQDACLQEVTRLTTIVSLYFLSQDACLQEVTRLTTIVSFPGCMSSGSHMTHNHRFLPRMHVFRKSQYSQPSFPSQDACLQDVTRLTTIVSLYFLYQDACLQEVTRLTTIVSFPGCMSSGSHMTHNHRFLPRMHVFRKSQYSQPSFPSQDACLQEVAILTTIVFFPGCMSSGCHKTHNHRFFVFSFPGCMSSGSHKTHNHRFLPRMHVFRKSQYSQPSFSSQDACLQDVTRLTTIVSFPGCMSSGSHNAHNHRFLPRMHIFRKSQDSQPSFLHECPKKATFMLIPCVKSTCLT